MFLGQRLNFYVALALFLGAIVAFVWSVRRGPERVDAPAPSVPRTPGGTRARPAGSRKRR
jgi:hypothetical protein